MSQTASGLARLAALILATTLFGLAWSGDQDVQQQFTIARREAGQSSQLLLAQNHRSTTPAGKRVASGNVRMDETLRGSRATLPVPTSTSVASYRGQVEVEMELPRGITAGRYRVVDQSGLLQTVRVISSDTAAVPRDLYVVDHADGPRRYFIRLDEDAAPPATHAASSGQSSPR